MADKEIQKPTLLAENDSLSQIHPDDGTFMGEILRHLEEIDEVEKPIVEARKAEAQRDRHRHYYNNGRGEPIIQLSDKAKEKIRARVNRLLLSIAGILTVGGLGVVILDRIDPSRSTLPASASTITITYTPQPEVNSPTPFSIVTPVTPVSDFSNQPGLADQLGAEISTPDELSTPELIIELTPAYIDAGIGAKPSDSTPTATATPDIASKDHSSFELLEKKRIS